MPYINKPNNRLSVITIQEFVEGLDLVGVANVLEDIQAWEYKVEQDPPSFARQRQAAALAAGLCAENLETARKFIRTHLEKAQSAIADGFVRVEGLR
jgi:hypothetical protein